MDEQGGRAEILVVEDSATQAEGLKYILEKNGYAARVAANGIEALELMRQRRPDMVISDIVMPGMDGYELCKRMRHEEGLKDVPVILLTSLSDPKDVIKGLESGANNFIMKPYDGRYLLSRIQYLQSNAELRKDMTAEMGIRVYFAGEHFFINAERLQILDLLLSTYENSYNQNCELIKARNELSELNDELDMKVRERTAELEAEVEMRKQAEETLLASETRYRRLFEAAKDGILIMDADTGDITDVNPFLADLLGYANDDLLGKKLWEIGAFSDIHLSRDAYAELVDKGYVRFDDLPLRTLDGRLIDVEFVSNVYYSDYNKVIQCNIRDITERKIAERTLKEKNEEIREISQQLWQATKLATVGELAASIAHELNNPLATVSLRVEALLAKASNDDPQRKALEVIEQEVERMGNLVANMLQFSRRSTQQISTIDVREELDKTLELIYYHLRKRNIVVVREYCLELPHVHADRQQLRQLFLNLFTNAGDAMPHGGTLTIKISPADTHITVEICDTGTGIAPENLSKVMEPFFTTKPEGTGTGLGLPICKRIVEEHKGTLDIHSEAGKGTTVVIFLPVKNGNNSKLLKEEMQ